MEAEALQEKAKKNEYTRTLTVFYKFSFWSFGEDKESPKSLKILQPFVRWEGKMGFIER